MDGFETGGRDAPFRVLLVEDEPADAHMVRLAFRKSRAPIDLRHVTDGVEALAFLRREPPHLDAPRPDIILLDLNMPRMDGRRFLQVVKADDDLRGIPVVVMTTSDMDRDVEASYTAGANSFMTKPMEMNDLFDMIAGLEAYWFSLVRLPDGG